MRGNRLAGGHRNPVQGGPSFAGDNEEDCIRSASRDVPPSESPSRHFGYNLLDETAGKPPPMGIQSRPSPRRGARRKEIAAFGRRGAGQGNARDARSGSLAV